MRIIAGKFGGRRLKSPPSAQTRPTSDRLRETLFNVLAPRTEGARVLDLCAGTGAVGIEALSRGALHVTFVDQSRKMCALIEGNLKALDVGEDRMQLIESEAASFLKKRAKRNHSLKSVPSENTKAFDLIFFDPPYDADYEIVLNLTAEQAPQLLGENAVVIVEHHKKKDLPDEFGALKRYRILKQGDSVLSFFSV